MGKVSGTKKISRTKITVVIQDDVLKKLRKIQSELIRETLSSVSMSMVVNNILRKSIKEI